MNKKRFLFSLVLLCLSVNIFFAQSSCQSLTAGLINAFNDLKSDYVDFRKTAAEAFVEIIIPMEPNYEKTLIDLTHQAIDLQVAVFDIYGRVANDGWGEIGPRDLIIPTKKVTGTLRFTERTFITAASPFDKVTVYVHKTGGKAGASITACAKYENGHIYDKKTKSIGTGKETIGDHRRMVFSKMNEKFLTIHLVHKGLITDKFEYYVTIEGEFDEEEMEKYYKQEIGFKKDRLVSSTKPHIDGAKRSVPSNKTARSNESSTTRQLNIVPNTDFELPPALSKTTEIPSPNQATPLQEPLILKHPATGKCYRIWCAESPGCESCTLYWKDLDGNGKIRPRRELRCRCDQNPEGNCMRRAREIACQD